MINFGDTRFCMQYLLPLLLLLTHSGFAQSSSDSLLQDVIEVRGGADLVGTLIDYHYGEGVTLVTDDGEIEFVEWRRIERLNYRPRMLQGEDKHSSEDWKETGPAVWAPERRWRHQLLITTGISQERFDNDFFSQTNTIIGTGVNYHWVYTAGGLAVGPGAGFEVLSVSRGERMTSLTALLEYRPGKGRIRPLARMLGGANLVVGSDLLDIESRRIGHTLHPSIGLSFDPPGGDWMQLSFDVGYRLSSVYFTALTPNLEILERQINYQRLTLGLAARF